MVKESTKDVLGEINIKAYKERLKTLKKAQEYSQSDDIPKAVEYYGQYLNALASYFKIDEQKLNPKFFDPEKDTAELFLISHVYWDLSKAYDRSPRLALESIRCLDQFVKFTVGFKYQYINARMIKSYLRKRQAHNPKAFKEAHERIQVESKGCFISSELFGPKASITQTLRLFKDDIKYNYFGKVFIEFYYQIICPIFFKVNKYRLFKRALKPIVKFILLGFSNAYARIKCRQ